MSAEKRKYPRTRISESTIYHTRESDIDSADRTHYMGTITNISLGGVGMQVGFAHELNDELWLEGLEGFSEKRSGKIKWSIDLGDEEHYEVGIQFD